MRCLGRPLREDLIVATTNQGMACCAPRSRRHRPARFPVAPCCAFSRITVRAAAAHAYRRRWRQPGSVRAGPLQRLVSAVRTRPARQPPRWGLRRHRSPLFLGRLQGDGREGKRLTERRPHSTYVGSAGDSARHHRWSGRSGAKARSENNQRHRCRCTNFADGTPRKAEGRWVSRWSNIRILGELESARRDRCSILERGRLARPGSRDQTRGGFRWRRPISLGVSARPPAPEDGGRARTAARLPE